MTELAEGHAELGDYYFDASGTSVPLSGSTNVPLNSIPIRRLPTAIIRFSYSESGERMKLSRKYVERANWILCPLDIADNAAWTLLYSRRYDEAVNQFHNVLEMNPNFRRARWGLARTYELKGMYKQAISECLKIPRLAKHRRVRQRPCSEALFALRKGLHNLRRGTHQSKLVRVGSPRD